MGGLWTRTKSKRWTFCGYFCSFWGQKIHIFEYLSQCFRPISAPEIVFEENPVKMMNFLIHFTPIILFFVSFGTEAKFLVFKPCKMQWSRPWHCGQAWRSFLAGLQIPPSWPFSTSFEAILAMFLSSQIADFGPFWGQFMPHFGDFLPTKSVKWSSGSLPPNHLKLQRDEEKLNIYNLPSSPLNALKNCLHNF